MDKEVGHDAPRIMNPTKALSKKPKTHIVFLISVSTLKCLALVFFCLFVCREEVVRFPLPSDIHFLDYQILSSLAFHPQIVPLLEYIKDC